MTMLDNVLSIDLKTPSGRMKWAKLVVYGYGELSSGIDEHAPENPDRSDNPAMARRGNRLKLWSLLRCMQVFREHEDAYTYQLVAKFIRDEWGIPNPQDVYKGDIEDFATTFCGSSR